ncbi:MAG: tetratricopeptide repeat protein [Sphingomicrobium sp.]
MKALTLATVTLLMLGTAVPVTAGVITVGGGFARSCYQAAEARDTTQDSLQTCDYALTTQALTAEDIIATHVNRGIIRMLRNDALGAVQDYDEALRMDPQQPEAWLNKAVLTLDRGDSRAASQMAQKALDLRTKKPGIAMYIRAVANEDSGNITAAYADYTQAAQLEPGWALPREELKRYSVKNR